MRLAASKLYQHLRDLARMNPIYEGLRRELAGLTPSDLADGRAALIRLNMDRARTIPADPRSLVTGNIPAGYWLQAPRDVAPVAADPAPLAYERF